jgi:hypothetical protein
VRPVTERGVLACEHGTGLVSPAPSQGFVRIGGARVLVRGDTAGRPVAGCPPLPPLKPCTATVREGGGFSTLLFVGGVPVALSGLVGITDGEPQTQVRYEVRSPGQRFVSAP